MSEEKQPSSRDADEELKVVYQEVCSSFHAIADFRAKLLGFLPLASGAGIFLLLNRSLTDGTEQYLLPIGVFGVAILGTLVGNQQTFLLGMHIAFVVAGGVLVLGLVAAWVFVRTRQAHGLRNEM